MTRYTPGRNSFFNGSRWTQPTAPSMFFFMIAGAILRIASRSWFWPVPRMVGAASITTHGPMNPSKPAASSSATTVELRLTAGVSTGSGPRNLYPSLKGRTRKKTSPRQRKNLKTARTSRMRRHSLGAQSSKWESRRDFLWAPKTKRRSPKGDRLSHHEMRLQRLYVLSLPALGPFGHVELHRLALLQALEAARLDR